MSFTYNDILLTYLYLFFTESSSSTYTTITSSAKILNISLQLKLLVASVASKDSVEGEHAEWYIGASLWQIDFNMLASETLVNWVQFKISVTLEIF